MTLIKNKIPILEYDDSPCAVLMPTHEKLDIHLPEKAVFVFLGDNVEAYACSEKAEKVAEFVSVTKKYPIYVVDYGGEKICLCQAPMGSASSTQILDWLIGYGVRKVIAAGSCGVLEEIPENVFLVPVKALRDEGTSYHYIPPSRYVELNQEARISIEKTFEKWKLPYVECITWTTDGFYRETQDMVNYRKEEGCAVVEMECASLAACAQFRGICFGQILFTADTLADVEDYRERGFGEDSFEIAMGICMDIIHIM